MGQSVKINSTVSKLIQLHWFSFRTEVLIALKKSSIQIQRFSEQYKSDQDKQRVIRVCVAIYGV